MSKFGEALQSVFSQGLDAAKQIKLAQLQFNDPTGYVVGPNGQRVPIGQQSSFAGAVAGVPPVVWIAGALVVGAVVLPLILRR